MSVFDVSCKYYNPERETWLEDGLVPGEQNERNQTVCLTYHLTTFGALTIPQLSGYLHDTTQGFYNSLLSIDLFPVIFYQEIVSTSKKPNTLRQAELDLTPTSNIAAICLIIGVILSYILLMIFFRFLDNHDLKFLSSIPLCGQDGPFSYEITIKTGMGWTAGTTANVGIRLYGTEEKSGSRHLRKLYQK